MNATKNGAILSRNYVMVSKMIVKVFIISFKISVPVIERQNTPLSRYIAIQ